MKYFFKTKRLPRIELGPLEQKSRMLTTRPPPRPIPSEVAVTHKRSIFFPQWSAICSWWLYPSFFETRCWRPWRGKINLSDFGWIMIPIEIGKKRVNDKNSIIYWLRRPKLQLSAVVVVAAAVVAVVTTKKPNNNIFRLKSGCTGHLENWSSR